MCLSLTIISSVYNLWFFRTVVVSCRLESLGHHWSGVSAHQVSERAWIYPSSEESSEILNQIWLAMCVYIYIYDFMIDLFYFAILIYLWIIRYDFSADAVIACFCMSHSANAYSLKCRAGWKGRNMGSGEPARSFWLSISSKIPNGALLCTWIWLWAMNYSPRL